MKNKYFIVLMAMMLSMMAFGIAYGDKSEVTAKGHAEISISSHSNVNNIENDATSTDDNKNDQDDNDDKDATSTNPETHGSVVSAFVHSLLQVADREGGIGQQVREVAQSQNDSATTTSEAMAKVEERSSIRTFLLGSDYKNLGVIRSEMAKTDANISQLDTLLNKTTNNIDRENLKSQITVLQDEQIKVNAFVTEHESKFSLFGWFSKLFSK